MKQQYLSFNVWIQNGRYLQYCINWKTSTSYMRRQKLWTERDYQVSSHGLHQGAYKISGWRAEDSQHLKSMTCGSPFETTCLLHNNDIFILHAYKLPELSSAHQVRKFKATVTIHAHNNNQCTTPHTLPLKCILTQTMKGTLLHGITFLAMHIRYLHFGIIEDTGLVLQVQATLCQCFSFNSTSPYRQTKIHMCSAYSITWSWEHSSYKQTCWNIWKK
jgi:hypothetical protein